ncbi:uncharacterized protein [Triticum aestivum]|uniref:uncharacterized protein n=1 Tax=Triticum aestivum TaxID=4565 RepID=UPI001D022D75|nr:uncharacterized protein LOC123065393 [Triticum aestivum]XP_044445343.1 uncharacterized protein LOC123172440 [Triticum aestivum]
MRPLTLLPQSRRHFREEKKRRLPRHGVPHAADPQVGENLVPEGSSADHTRRTVVGVTMQEGTVLSGDERVCGASGAAAMSGQGRICSTTQAMAMSRECLICSAAQAAVVRRDSSPHTSELSTGKITPEALLRIRGCGLVPLAQPGHLGQPV